MRKLNVYLCSRVALDARPFNDRVSKSLRDSGLITYVPHEQAPNNLTQADIDHGRYDKDTIFKIDFEAMRNADACVVVGRTGRDCAWEIGWFAAQGIPIFFIPNGDKTYDDCPMIRPSLNVYPHLGAPEKVGAVVSEVLSGVYCEAK